MQRLLMHQFRTTIIDDIAAIHADACKILADGLAAQYADFFIVAAFARGLHPGRKAFGHDILTDLDRLSRKLEVARKIYAAYRRTDFKPHPTKPPADSATVNALLAAILEAYRQTRNLRYLNTVYKTVQVGLIIPEDTEADWRILPTAEKLLWGAAEHA